MSPPVLEGSNVWTEGMYILKAASAAQDFETAFDSNFCSRSTRSFREIERKM